ncbi:glycosyltransferase family 2 protein [Candidatus Uhrbacteria bacterium]|nr:glycosyltransferase family 2 protein [Candidatus Uhrbacteria bacterium]
MSDVKLLIAIPAYNEATRIDLVVRECLKVSPDVIVIDDGSTDSTGQYAAQAGAHVLRHTINRDLGGALQTAFAYARESDADVLVTIDGDGQFSPGDIPRLIAPIVAGDADVVFGSRFLQENQVPFKRRLGNIVANIVTWFLFGAHVSDTQSGFRAFHRAAFATMILHTNGMEISSEIVQEVWNRKLRIAEVPVSVTYDAYTGAKGQGFRRGLRTLGALILRRMT